MVHSMPFRRSEASDDRGASLFEVLIATVIAALLAGTATISLAGTTSSAAVVACSANVKVVEIAVEAYDVQTGGTPIVTAALLTENPSLLRSFPTSRDYTISIDASGNVRVAAPPSAPDVAADTPEACTGAGSVTSKPSR
jgi:competence protein ComGC